MKLFFCFLFCCFFGVTRAQTNLCQGSLGDPVVNITFGHGKNPGAQLSAIVPGASTTLIYIGSGGDPASPPPNDGQYSISNGVPFNPTWFFRAKDHTGTYSDGYMAIYNASAQPGEFYRQTVTGLCGSTTYEFAAWLANVLNPYLVVEDLHPDVTFIIEQTDGTQLASFDTGPVMQTSYFSWQQYGLFFTTPASVSTIVLRMINNNPGGANHQGNDLAIDDITFRACGPTLNASLSAAQAIDSLTVCEHSAVHLNGAITTGYANPAYFWQYSADSGQSWIDIPSSNLLQLDVLPPITGSLIVYQYRLVIAESVNIGSASCRVASNKLFVTLDPDPQAQLTGLNTCYGSLGKLLFTATAGIGPFSIGYADQLGNNYSASGVVSGDSVNVPTAIIDTLSFMLLSMIDSKGCQNASVAPNITYVNPLPLPQGALAGGTGCAGDTARVQFNATQGRAPFQLVISDGITQFTVNQASGQGIVAIPGAINNATMTYLLVSITDSNGLGCTRNTGFVQTQATVTVLPSPVIAFDALAPVCQHDPAQKIKVQETTGLPGAGAFYSSAVSAAGDFDPNRLTPGSYPVTYRYDASNGCSAAVTQTLVVNAVPTANAGADILACVGSLVQLQATGGTNYQWSPADGLSDPLVSNPIATGSTTITYSVDVSAAGCHATDTMTVIISPLGKDAYRVPNAFTPNGDGHNDCFGLQRWGGIDLLEFSIYNRWGQQLFHTRSTGTCWDGSFNGKPQPAGGYVYVIRANTPCGLIFLKGSIVLIR